MEIKCPTCGGMNTIEEAPVVSLDCSHCNQALIAGIDEDAAEYGADPVFVQAA